MSENNEHETSNPDSEVTLQAFGKTLSVKGLSTIFVIIIVAFAGGLSFMLYDLSSSSSKAVESALRVQSQSIAEHRALMDSVMVMQDNQRVIIEGIKNSDNALKIQNYILLANQTMREEIRQRLAMPKELREMGIREK
jgi:hypothetical protein